jgi:hypothetical protein
VNEFISKIPAPVLLVLAVFTGSHEACHAVPPAVTASQGAANSAQRPGEVRFGPYYLRAVAYKKAAELVALEGYRNVRVVLEPKGWYVYASKQ